eukprot:TRINITY_DN2323_c0_g1_i1.p1 TRINITY_DN2323_c0_g1~~TRINITY_DN2323_c0_g1_i1.p1  ORF type:complete len:1850 (-),score=340.01 TRINITY_DN2323_c0_g1_i1:35-5485(-)
MDTVKLGIVGQENVGKSFLVSCVKQTLATGKKRCKCTTPIGSTQGIERDTAEVKLSSSTLHLNIMDFAGNEAFYPMHSYFITEKSIYFVVWNANASYKSSRVEHWIQTIHFYAPKSPIFLVGTHRDTLTTKLGSKHLSGMKEKLLSKFNKIADNKIQGVHFVSCTTGKGIKKLVRDLTDTIGNLPYVQHTIPTEIVSFETNLFQKRETRKQLPIIQWGTVVEIAKQSNINENKVLSAVRFLELSGTICYFPGKEALGFENLGRVPVEKMRSEEGLVILNTDFLMELLEAIIDMIREEAKNGIVSAETLRRAVVFNLAGPLQSYVFRLLELFEFIVLLPDDEVLVPSFLSVTPIVQDIWPTYDPTKIHFFRDYIIRFSPYGFFSRLVVRLLQLPYKNHYWRYGVILLSDDGACLVSYDVNTCRIRLSARGIVEHEIVGLFCNILRIVDALFDDQFQIVPEVEVPCTECVLSSEKVPTFFSKAECEAAIASQFQCVECNNKAAKSLHRLLIHQIAPDIAMRDYKAKMTPFSAITINEEIGRGAFAVVYKGLYRGKSVAVKKLLITFDSAGSDNKKAFKELQEFRREVRAMTKLKHPNLVELKAFSVGEVLSLVCEFISHGNLYDFIHTATFDWTMIYRISYDLAVGLSYLHSVNPPLVHRDLKSPNVLMSSITATDILPVAKIADFGLTRELVTENFAPQLSRNRDVANPTWLAPEVIRGDPHGVSSDIYPLGIIFWELYSKKHPFDNYPFATDMEEDILKGVRPPVFSDCPAEYMSIMARCWAGNPSVRPTAPELTEKIEGIINATSPELVRALQSHKQSCYRHRDKDLMRKSYAETGLLRPPKEVSRVIEVEANKPQLEFKKGASETLVNIWKGDVAPTILEAHSTKKNPIRRVDNQVFAIPFPENPSEMAYVLKNIVKDSEASAYRIYCITSTTYNYTLFEGSILVYDIDPELPPAMTEIVPIIEHIQEWTSVPGQLAFIHCQIGTPVLSAYISSCLLLKREKQLSAANQMFETITEKSLSNYPSYKRYIQYFNKFLKSPPENQKKTNLHLHKLRFSCIPSFSLTETCNPVFSVKQSERKVFFSKDLKGKTETDTVEFFTRELRVTGDIKIEFFHTTTTRRMFSLAFNVNLEDFDCRNRIVFKKAELDRACLDTQQEHFKNNFSLEIFLLTEEVHHEMRRGSFSANAFTSASASASASASGNTTPQARRLPPTGIKKSPLSSPFNSLSYSSSTNLQPVVANPRSRPVSLDNDSSSSASTLTSNKHSFLRCSQDGSPGISKSIRRRDLLVPPKPPPVPNVPKNYFSYRREAPSPSSAAASQLCPICDKSLNTGFTIEIFIDTTIHVNCMKCGTCGRSLQDSNDQCLLKDNKITCRGCAKDLFPSCKICTQPIRSSVVRTANSTFHKSCLVCATCNKELGGNQPYCVDNNVAVCHTCAINIGIEKSIYTEATLAELPNNDELLNILKNDLEKEHFLAFLKERGVGALLSFWEEAQERKCLDEEERRNAYYGITNCYLTQFAEAKLPPLVLSRVEAALEREVKKSGCASKDLFKPCIAIVFSELAKHVKEFTQSPQFKSYLTDLGEMPDDEEEEEDLRRSRIAKLIPIVASDLPRIRVKKERVDEEELMRLKEEEEARRMEEHRREEARIAEEKKVQALRDAEARMMEEQKRMAAQREADMRFLEQKRLEHEAALKRVRMAQDRAFEASEKAKEVSRQNEITVREQQAVSQVVGSVPSRPAAAPPSSKRSSCTAGLCTVCKRAYMSTDYMVKAPGFVVHPHCFKCNKCNNILANKPYVFADNKLWCDEDYSLVNNGTK